MPQINSKKFVEKKLKSYFKTLNGEECSGVHKMFMEDIEKSLLEFILNHTNNNQTKAAKILGINRATLRKKIKIYSI